MSNYSELLRDPRWQKKRLDVMNRDKFTCLQCGSTKKTLNVHHQYYVKGRMPWEYNDDSLLTLCEDCHHGVNSHDWVKAFLDLGLTPADLVHLACLVAYKKKKILTERPDGGHDIMRYMYYDLEFENDDDIREFSINFEKEYKERYSNG